MARRWTPARSIFLGCVGLVLGCGDNLPLGDPPLHPVPGCEGIDPAACDVRTPPCHVRLLAMATCLTGEPLGEMPPVTVMS